LKTCLNIDPDHKITLNSGHIVLAMTRKPTPRIGSLSMNTVHRSQPDRFVSDNEIIELLKYVGHNPQTHGQHANEVGSTNTISSPRYSNSNLQQYIRISRPAWNIFLKCHLYLRPKTDNPISIDFHDTWDALVKQNNNALRNRPGIGYLTNPKRPTGLEWTCIGKAAAPSAHIHTSSQLQQLIESKTIDWATTNDWTNQHIQLSQHEWDKMEICKIAYHSTILTNGYLFQPGKKTHVKILNHRLHQVDTTPKTIQYSGADMPRQQQQVLNPIEAANTWQRLDPTADPFASLPKNYYHTVTNAFATNIIADNHNSPGMESIFALQPPNWLHDAIITWWLGYWCKKTGGLSNASITSPRQRNQNKIDGKRNTFFATPFFWNYVRDGEAQGNNETKYVDIFTCSRMLIPVNIKLKHWIMACIDFEQKWIAWLDSIGDTHEQETRLLFTWLTREHSLNRSTIFDSAEWSLHAGPPPGMQVPLQSNEYDCGIFTCLYAAFLDIGLPLSFSQLDTPDVRMWMAHEMIEEGKLLKMSHSTLHESLLATVRGNSDTSSDHLMASKRSPEPQLLEDIKRQKTYEQEASEEQKNVQAAAEFWTAMRHTHGFQNPAAGPQVQAAAANEVAPSPEPGTSSRQQAKAFPESQGNPKRKRGSHDAYTDPTNHTLDTIIARPAKRNKEFIGEYAKPNTTDTPHRDSPAGGSGDAASLTTNEAVKTVLANATSQYIAQTTHGFQTRTETPHDIDPLTDTPLSGRGNAASHTTHSKEQQRQTSPTTPPRQTINNDIVSRNTTTHGVLVGTDTIALTPVQGNSTTSPTKNRYRHKNRHRTAHNIIGTPNRYADRGPIKQ